MSVGSGPLRGFEVVPTLDTSQYASGDLLFNPAIISQEFWPNSHQVAILQALTIIDLGAESAAFDLVFLRAGTSWGSLNAAAAPSAAIVGTVVGELSIAAADYVSLGSNGSVISMSNIGLTLFGDDNDDRACYVAGISRGTPTYAASDLSIKLGILR